MSEIYVIHKTDDDATATRIHFALGDAHLDTWVDHVHGGEPQGPHSDADDRAMERCDVGLFVLSPASVSSPKCRRRWQAVLDDGKPLIVVVAEPIPADDLPDRLWDKQIPYVDLTTDAESGIVDLVQTIAGLVSS
jgi:TIR domain